MQQTGRCPNCGSPTALGQRFCGGCGAQLSTGCAYCGAAFAPGARFCLNCGAPVGGGAPPQQPGWGPQPAGGPQQPGWGAPQQPAWGAPVRTGQRQSNAPLLMVLLVVLLIGLGGLVYWQFGDTIMGMFSSSGGGADATPPVISSIEVSTGAISAIITWSTDELSSSQVEYGENASYGLLEPAQPAQVDQQSHTHGDQIEHDYEQQRVQRRQGGRCCPCGCDDQPLGGKSQG